MRKRLTDRLVQRMKLPPGVTMLDVWDTDLPGFALRLWASPRKPGGIARSYVVMYRNKAGRQRRYSIGSAYQIKLSDARQIARDRFTEVAAGVDVAELRRRERETARLRREGLSTPHTWGALVERFIEDYAKRELRETSWREYDRMLQREVLPRWKNRELEQVTEADIRELVRRKRNAGSPHAAEHLQHLLRRLCAWGVSEAYLPANPAANIERPGKHAPRDRELSDAELKALWPAFVEMGFPWGDLARLLLLTGARRDELRGLQPGELDTTEQIIRLRGDRTKSGRPHFLVLVPEALEILEALPTMALAKPPPFLFSTKRVKHQRPFSGLSKYKRRADELSGVTDWRVHDLRRTVATRLGKLNVPPHIISRLLGHAQRDITSTTYNQYDYLTERREALMMWAETLRGIIVDNPGAETPPEREA